MISEVDLRDWDRVDFNLISSAKREKVEYYNTEGAYNLLELFSQQVKELKEKQLRKIPKLERE